jgi:predicted nucleic acid-binding protein
MNPSSPWHDWSINQLQSCSEKAPLHVNLIIFSELLVPIKDSSVVDTLLDVFEVNRSTIPWNCAALAALAFRRYRQSGGQKLKPLPDFYIGAHASVSNLSLMTRDQGHFGTYFPKLRLISPEL